MGATSGVDESSELLRFGGTGICESRQQMSQLVDGLPCEVTHHLLSNPVRKIEAIPLKY